MAVAAVGMALVSAGPAHAAAATNWTQVSPATSPPARSGAAVAYDEHTGQLVVFGGTDSSGTFLDDTWIWDGTTWTQVHPAASPPARSGAAIAYDADSQQLVLFGGTAAGSSGLQGDTWTWDGTTWAQKKPADSPPSRTGAAMAYDVASSQMILFGGNAPFPAGDTWTMERHHVDLSGNRQRPAPVRGLDGLRPIHPASGPVRRDQQHADPR